MVRIAAGPAGALAVPLPAQDVGAARRRGAVVKRAPGTPPPAAQATESAAGEAFRRGQDFIARCIAGAPGTRDEFVVEYSGLIRFAIASVLRHRGVSLLREEMDDLTHNVIVSLFENDCRKLKMYEGRNQASFATFVRVCATRLTLDHLRWRQRRPALSEPEPAHEGRDLLADAPDPGPGPEARTATAEDLALLRRLVRALPPREQLLVRLHFVDGVEIPDVARILGVSENAAHVIKSRVRAKLRRQMSEADDDA